MERIVQEYLQRISAVNEPKEFINEALKFIWERDSWDSIKVNPFTRTIGIINRKMLPQPDATVYRVGNTWSLPLNKYHVCIGDTMKIAEGFRSISVENGVLVAEVSLYKDRKAIEVS